MDSIDNSAAGPTLGLRRYDITSDRETVAIRLRLRRRIHARLRRAAIFLFRQDAGEVGQSGSSAGWQCGQNE
jgi:hypothetical protein